MENRKGRRGTLTQEKIVREALRFRPDEFSFARIAESLGVSLQALYHYFPHKDALAEAMAEELNQLVDIEDHNAPWHEYLRSVLLSYRVFLKQSEYAYGRGSRLDELSFFRVGGKASERLLERFNGFIESLEKEGLSRSQCVEIWIVFQDFVRHSVLTGASQESLLAGWGELQADLESSDQELLPRLQTLREMPCPDIEATFAAAVDVLIGGIAKRYGLKEG